MRKKKTSRGERETTVFYSNLNKYWQCIAEYNRQKTVRNRGAIIM